MKTKLMLIISIVTLTGCAFPQPVPEWAVESCLRSHGKPVFISDAFGATRFECVINEGRNSLNARYFNNPYLIDGVESNGTPE